MAVPRGTDADGALVVAVPKRLHARVDRVQPPRSGAAASKKRRCSLQDPALQPPRSGAAASKIRRCSLQEAALHAEAEPPGLVSEKMALQKALEPLEDP